MQLRKYLAAPFAALLLTGASLANAAAPIDVTWNPSGAGITTAGPFTFDNVLINTYARSTSRAVGRPSRSRDSRSWYRVLEQRIADGEFRLGAFPGGTPYTLYIQFHGYRDSDRGHSFHRQLHEPELFAVGRSRSNDVRDSNNDGVFSVTGAPTITLATGQPDQRKHHSSPGSLFCLLRRF